MPKNETIFEATMTPSVDSLFAFAHEQQDKAFHTLQRGNPFSIAVIGNFLEFTPDSSSSPRRESRESVAAVLARLEKTNSFQMSDYQDISFNASYVLALVKSWQSPELLLSTSANQSERSQKSASSTRKKMIGHPEHVAREMMSEFYKINKANLPDSVRKHRELIVKMIMDGASPEQAFSNVNSL